MLSCKLVDVNLKPSGVFSIRQRAPMSLSAAASLLRPEPAASRRVSRQVLAASKQQVSAGPCRARPVRGGGWCFAGKVYGAGVGKIGEKNEPSRARPGSTSARRTAARHPCSRRRTRAPQSCSCTGTAARPPRRWQSPSAASGAVSS